MRRRKKKIIFDFFILYRIIKDRTIGQEVLRDNGSIDRCGRDLALSFFPPTTLVKIIICFPSRVMKTHKCRCLIFKLQFFNAFPLQCWQLIFIVFCNLFSANDFSYIVSFNIVVVEKSSHLTLYMCVKKLAIISRTPNTGSFSSSV